MSDDISLTEAERTAGIVRCDACPVLCRIRPGRAGAHGNARQLAARVGFEFGEGDGGRDRD